MVFKGFFWLMGAQSATIIFRYNKIGRNPTDQSLVPACSTL